MHETPWQTGVKACALPVISRSPSISARSLRRFWTRADPRGEAGPGGGHRKSRTIRNNFFDFKTQRFRRRIADNPGTSKIQHIMPDWNYSTKGGVMITNSGIAYETEAAQDPFLDDT